MSNDYKNLSKVCDRTLCPEDRRFASQGLPIDDKCWSRGLDFLSHTNTNSGLFFLHAIKKGNLYI